MVTNLPELEPLGQKCPGNHALRKLKTTELYEVTTAMKTPAFV
jgi:hypothetical protein